MNLSSNEIHCRKYIKIFTLGICKVDNNKKKELVQLEQLKFMQIEA